MARGRSCSPRTSSSCSRATKRRRSLALMPKLYYASPRDLPLIEPAAGLKGRVVQADHATMVIYDLAAKTIVESHKHEMEQFGVVVKGSLAMIIAGEQRILTPGDT